MHRTKSARSEDIKPKHSVQGRRQRKGKSLLSQCGSPTTSLRVCLQRPTPSFPPNLLSSPSGTDDTPSRSPPPLYGLDNPSTLAASSSCSPLTAAALDHLRLDAHPQDHFSRSGISANLSTHPFPSVSSIPGDSVASFGTPPPRWFQHLHPRTLLQRTRAAKEVTFRSSIEKAKWLRTRSHQSSTC